MTIIVTDTGFGPEDLYFGFCKPEDVTQDTPIPFGIDVTSDTDPDTLAPILHLPSAIRIDFPSFADGRGFSIAQRLRALGYQGRLRAHGPVIADQFAYLLACGFDEVAVPPAVAERQPAEQWTAQLTKISASYQRGRPGLSSILDQRRAAR